MRKSPVGNVKKETKEKKEGGGVEP